jgi:hypothetical protein
MPPPRGPCAAHFEHVAEVGVELKDQWDDHLVAAGDPDALKSRWSHRKRLRSIYTSTPGGSHRSAGIGQARLALRGEEDIVPPTPRKQGGERTQEELKARKDPGVVVEQAVASP